MKSRISVNNSSYSRITQNPRVTEHEEQFPKLTFHEKKKSANQASRENPCTTLFKGTLGAWVGTETSQPSRGKNVKHLTMRERK